MLRFLLVFHFIYNCLRKGARPHRYFQLNADYFNEERGIFSKLDIDRVIPERFHLAQWLDDGVSEPGDYPVFVKPEWGQNSHSICRADNSCQLAEIRRRNRTVKSRFVVQEAAPGVREFELFYIRSAELWSKPAIFSLTETENLGGERLPVNSINNSQTRYRHLTSELSSHDCDVLWGHVGTIGEFRIARVGVRADSIADLLRGCFKIIEINIFLPMPLVLLDSRVDFSSKHTFIRQSMAAVARQVAALPEQQRAKHIFFKKVLAHYRVKT